MEKESFCPFEICPAVCAAGKNYVICVPTPAPVIMSVFIGGEEFTNDVCGVKISSCSVQKFTVPVALLDREKSYIVSYEIIYREAYFSKKEPPVERKFSFAPLEDQEEIRIYHLSDVHGKKDAAVAAAQYFGAPPDLLILNGDISSSSQTERETLLPLEIAFAITKGERPCVITRGNHDLRGLLAERIGEFYPLDQGLFYYTVRLGPLWMLVLDCGEDKDDGHEEYAGTIAFHKYRVKETAFIQSLTKSDRPEYGDPSVKYKIILSHIPFMHTDYDPESGQHKFDIEQDTYKEWVELINTFIRPDFGLFGHVHRTGVFHGPGKYNQKGFSAPFILGGKPLGNDVTGCAITLRQSAADIIFNGKERIPESEHEILFE